MKRLELEQLLEEHDMPVENKALYQCFQIPCVGSHGYFIQIRVITQGNIEIGHCLFIKGGNGSTRKYSFVYLIDTLLLMVNGSIPQVPCFTIQYIFRETVRESLLSWEAHPHFLHQKPS